MILTIDVGNTNTVFGGFEDNSLRFTARVATDITKAEDEYATLLYGILTVRHIDPSEITGAILSSVVPPLNRVLCKAVRFICGTEPLTVGPGIKTGINIHCDAPSSVGTDMICACVAVRKLYGAPALIADLGTATKMMVLDENGTFIGVSIIPGVMMGLNALAEQTAQLPKISLQVPSRVIEKNTADCMKSGVIFGNASLIDGMIDRIRSEVGAEIPVYATGGMANMIVPHCKHTVTVHEHLVLEGLNLIYQKNIGV